MNTINPFEDPPEKKGASAPLAGRELWRIARQVRADANAGRSSYTMGMLIITTITCAAILGVCGTSLQDIMTSDEARGVAIPYIIGGVAAGIPFGIIVALFVRISTPTIFLGAMMGGLLGSIVAPAALQANETPTAALAAAAILGPALILIVSYVFAHLSSRTGAVDATPAQVSPWDTLPDSHATKSASAGELLEPAEAVEEQSPVT